MANNKYNKKELSDWFSGKVKTAVGYRRKIVSSVDRSRTNTVIGKMYFYWYDPKHKDTLPVYDRFPLVFPIERYSDGFLGLNLHYLSQDERADLLNKLMKYKSSSNLTERTKLKLSYDLLASTKRIANQMRPCIKRYLFTHVRSSFIEVPATEWDRAIELPVEFFVVKR
jgi:hypothetical protein